MVYSRRDFLKKIACLSAGTFLLPNLASSQSRTAGESELFFDISLAEWSLYRQLFAGELSHMDFPAVAVNEFDINAVEYVTQFFPDKAEDRAYLGELNSRCEDLGVNQLLIMVDGEGELAGSSETARRRAVENHYKWVDAARYLNCHSIRVNLFGDGSRAEQKRASIKSLRTLSQFAKKRNINILVENHGGYSSDAAWLSDIMQEVALENCGTLPDLGNFCLRRRDGDRWESPCVDEYDRYKGVRQLMPYARGVSAKAYGFGADGRETTINYRRMLKIVKDAGFSGYIGIEYEGEEMPAYEGIRATKRLLTKLGSELTK